MSKEQTLKNKNQQLLHPKIITVKTSVNLGAGRHNTAHNRGHPCLIPDFRRNTANIHFQLHFL